MAYKILEEDFFNNNEIEKIIKDSVYEVEVTAKLLNIRKHPSMTSEVVRIVKQGDRFWIVDETPAWGQLEDDTWVRLDFVKKI